MSLRGLQYGVLNVPLGAGLDQKADSRVSNSPSLDKCINAQFDEIGGLQTRYPFASIGNSILGGGTISSARKLAVSGDELICFTKDKIYSWSPAISKWINKGTHLAAKIDEASRFVTTGDQIDCERAELSGTVVYAWGDRVGGISLVYVAAMDTTTGAVLCTPTRVGTLGSDISKPRLIALASKIILLVSNTGNTRLEAYSIDPADVPTSVAASATVVGSTSHNAYYDACAVDLTPGSERIVVAQRLTPTTSYGVFTLSVALATVTTRTVARTSLSTQGVAVIPTAGKVAVVRSPTATTVVADILAESTLADSSASVALGSTATNSPTSIAVAFNSTDLGAGVYQATAFWASDESTSGTGWQSRYNTVTSAGVAGSEATFLYHLAPKSRAFTRDGYVYVWMGFFCSSSFAASASTVFGLQLQNSYFLYRSDKTLHGKAAAAEAGVGAGGYAADAAGHLPTVQSLGSDRYAFCAMERRVFTSASNENQSTYAGRAPREVIVTFDSNEARRTAKLGKTLYIAGSEILQYDGVRTTEVGFHIYPWAALAVSGIAGSIPTGQYAYKGTYRSNNAQGEIDRSTTASTGAVDVAAGPKGVTISAISSLLVTHKTANEAAIEVWRTTISPTIDSPFYLITDPSPTNTANPNRYAANDSTASTIADITDTQSDASISDNATNDENGGILENVAPLPATIIAATEDRIFLAGIANRPHEVRYSRLRTDGEVASFHEALTFSVPQAGGDITGIGFLNETVIVFRESAIYAFPGDGFANDGTGINYGPARILSVDVGATSAEAIALIEQGIIFKSAKGWYLLNHGWACDYIGAPVVDYDSETPLAINVVGNRHQVRILTSARMLVWDYYVNQWGEWTITSGLHAVIWNGTHHYLTSTGPYAEASTYSGVDYGIDIETSWVKLNDLQGFGRVRRLLVLGEYRSAHDLRIRLARDYADTSGSSNYFQDTYWTVSPTTTGGREEVRMGPSIQQMGAVKIRISAVSNSNHANPPSGEAVKLSGIALEIGVKRGPFAQLPAAQKT